MTGQGSPAAAGSNPATHQPCHPSALPPTSAAVAAAEVVWVCRGVAACGSVARAAAAAALQGVDGFKQLALLEPLARLPAPSTNTPEREYTANEQPMHINRLAMQSMGGRTKRGCRAAARQHGGRSELMAGPPPQAGWCWPAAWGGKAWPKGVQPAAAN